MILSRVGYDICMIPKIDYLSCFIHIFIRSCRFYRLIISAYFFLVHNYKLVLPTNESKK